MPPKTMRKKTRNEISTGLKRAAHSRWKTPGVGPVTTEGSADCTCSVGTVSLNIDSCRHSRSYLPCDSSLPKVHNRSMLMKTKIFLVPIVVVMVCLLGWTAHARLQKNSPALQTWEYQAYELEARFQTTAKLNQMGAQGWELVTVVSECPSAASDCK